MVSKILKFGKQKGSSFVLPAHGRAGFHLRNATDGAGKGNIFFSGTFLKTK